MAQLHPSSQQAAAQPKLHPHSHLTSPPHVRHPYYPPDPSLFSARPNAAPLPYAPNASSAATLVLLILSGLAAATWLLSFAVRGQWRRATRRERWTSAWFAVCGILHVGFEGSFVLRWTTIAGGTDIIAEMWKEYALGDSRYLTADTQVLCMEVLSTIILGPLSLLCAWWIMQRDPRRVLLQPVVCMGHLYSVALYYLTSFVDMAVHGKSYSRPEFLYFWGYFIGFNLPWVVVPAMILRDSFKRAGLARQKSQKTR